jgi:hypothetical protein
VIPDLDENGYLPPGIHGATIVEIEQRFGRETEVRRAQVQSLRWLLELADRDDVRRIIINGSFVTATAEPGDVDCAPLAGTGFGNRGVTAKEWSEGLPFLHIEIVDERGLNDYVEHIFAVGRHQRPKGMIEVIR